MLNEETSENSLWLCTHFDDKEHIQFQCSHSTQIGINYRNRHISRFFRIYHLYIHIVSITAIRYFVVLNTLCLPHFPPPPPRIHPVPLFPLMLDVVVWFSRIFVCIILNVNSTFLCVLLYSVQSNHPPYSAGIFTLFDKRYNFTLRINCNTIHSIRFVKLFTFNGFALSLITNTPYSYSYTCVYRYGCLFSHFVRNL